jgi:hypothetical protein
MAFICGLMAATASRGGFILHGQGLLHLVINGKGNGAAGRLFNSARNALIPAFWGRVGSYGGGTGPARLARLCH